MEVDMYGTLFFWMGIALVLVITIWHLGIEVFRYLDKEEGNMLLITLKGVLITCGMIFLLISNGQRMTTEMVNPQGDDTVVTVPQKRVDEVAKEKATKDEKQEEAAKKKQKVDEKDTVKSMDDFRKDLMNRRGE
jgi:hypothetical protein